MGELAAHLYMGLVQLFSGLFPEHFRESARTGPIWRRIIFALFFGFGSLIVGLVVAACVLAVAFVLFAIVVGIFRAFLT
jgi:hypothetical protein